jgi:hypothetical protein
MRRLILRAKRSITFVDTVFFYINRGYSLRYSILLARDTL